MNLYEILEKNIDYSIQFDKDKFLSLSEISSLLSEKFEISPNLFFVESLDFEDLLFIKFPEKGKAEICISVCIDYNHEKLKVCFDIGRFCEIEDVGFFFESFN